MHQEISLLSIISDNFAVILSTTVTIISVLSNIFLARTQAKNNAGLKYIDLKFEAFKSFLDSLSRYDGNPTSENFDNLVSAQNQVIILAHSAYTEMLDNFCKVLTEISNARHTQNGVTLELETEFKNNLKVIRCMLQDEIQDLDPSKHKLAKRFLKKEKRRKFLKKFHNVFAKTKNTQKRERNV